MKKVLFVVATTLQNAGVPHVMMKIVRELSGEFIFDVAVFGEEKGYFDEEFLSFGGKILRCPVPQNQNGLFGFLKKSIALHNFLKVVLSETHYDAIHCNNGFEAAVALQIASKKNVSVRISHAHGYYPVAGRNPISRAYKVLCQKAINRYATVTLACSTKAGDSLYGGAPYTNVLNPVDLSQYCFSKEPHEGVNLLQIGYYNKLKNQLFTLKVLKGLLEKGLNVRLYFIGYSCGNDYLAAMEQYITKENLVDYVTFLATDYPKHKIMPKIDFLLLPSTSEGLPLVALEGQAAHILCITSTAVCEDVNMGLFSSLPISSPSVWADFICSNLDYADTLDEEKIRKLDTKEYVTKIRRIYER